MQPPQTLSLLEKKMNQKQRRVDVWRETKAHYQSQPYVKSEIIEDLDAKYVPAKKFPTTRMEFVRGDCVDAAIVAKKEGLNPLLLNMASWFKPGGGVEDGAGAQEEDLFRRSNYYKFLNRRDYPFPKFRSVLSRGVEFSRRGREHDYAFMQTPVLIDCIAAPAVRHPELTANNRLKSEDANTMRRKIDALCQIAVKNGNDCLILSAWGCGAFRCPPEHIGSLFREVINKYICCFRKIVFAIVGDDMDNYGWFKKGFGGQGNQAGPQQTS